MQYKKQYDLFMKYLDEHTNVRWVEGQYPSDFIPRCFPHTPIYICCFKNSYRERKLYYKTKAEFERNPSYAEEIIIEIED